MHVHDYIFIDKPSFIVDDPTPEQKLLVHQAKQYMQGNGDTKVHMNLQYKSIKYRLQ